MKKVGNYWICIAPFFMLILVQTLAEPIILAIVTVCTDRDPYRIIGSNYMVYLCLLQIVSVIPAFLWYYFEFYKKSLKPDRPAFTGRSVLAAACTGLALYLFLSLFMGIAKTIFPQLMNGYDTMIEDNGIASLSFVSTLSTLLLAPLEEEIIFRGLTIRLAERIGASFLLANFIQAALFGLVHMNLIQGSYAFVLGLALGYFYHRCKTVFIPMMLHSVFNFCGTYLAFALSVVPDTLYTKGLMFAVGFIALAVSAALLRKDAKIITNKRSGE